MDKRVPAVNRCPQTIGYLETVASEGASPSDLGNMLNHLSVSVGALVDLLRRSFIEDVGRVVDMMEAHAGSLAQYLTRDQKGKRVLPYLGQLAEHLSTHRALALQELFDLHAKLEDMKRIVDDSHTQRPWKKQYSTVKLAELVEETVRVHQESLDELKATLQCEFRDASQVVVDKPMLQTLLSHLIQNAIRAMKEASPGPHALRLRILPCHDREGFTRVQVEDTGVGLPPTQLTQIFSEGFARRNTRQDLFACAQLAKSLGGSLRAWSDGPQKGAVFTLDVPLIDKEAKGSWVPI